MGGGEGRDQVVLACPDTPLRNKRAVYSGRDKLNGQICSQEKLSEQFRGLIVHDELGKWVTAVLKIFED